MGVVEEKSYDRIDNFIRDISYGGELYHLFCTGHFIFRGHSSDKYELIPSALRLKAKGIFDNIARKGSLPFDIEYIQIEDEYRVLRQFYKKCDKEGLYIPNIDRIRITFNDVIDINTSGISETWLPYDLWEIAALAQHYGLPTRLLDWTHDLYVALYFSIEDQLESRPLPENTEHFVLWALDLPPLSIGPDLNFPFRIIQPIYHGNPNLSAQQGLFTMWQTKKEVNHLPQGGTTINVNQLTNRKPLNTLLQEYANNNEKTYIGPYLKKILLPLDDAKELYKFLIVNGYTAAKIYPGYYGVVHSIKHNNFLQ